MNEIKSVLVGIDFTEPSAAALAQGVRIAGRTGAHVRALHVIEILVVADLEEALSPFQRDIQAGLLGDARRAWEQFAPGVSKEGVRFDVSVGTPLAEVVSKVRSTNADLLVMGVYGASGPTRGTGTLATQCVRKAPTSVLLVQEGKTSAFERVVACVDFSETSRRAVAAAARVAASDGAALHVLHVFQAPWARYHYRSPTPQATPDFQRQYADALRGRLRTFCEPLAKDPAWGGLAVSYELREDRSHGAGIGEFIRASGADLCVLGTRGRTNLRDVLLGSTAERVVRDAACSILTVRPAEPEAAA